MGEADSRLESSKDAKRNQRSGGAFNSSTPSRETRAPPLTTAPWQIVLRVGMRFNVMLGGFASMMIGLETMAVRDVGVVTGEVMLTPFVVLGGFAVMLSGLFVMAGGGVMMLGFVQFGHFLLPRRAATAASESVPVQDANGVTFT
jgi:hypothetical protein